MADCDPNTLSNEAKCFQCYDPLQVSAVEVLLLARIAGVDPDPDALLEQAKDFVNMDQRQLLAMQVMLLCRITTL